MKAERASSASHQAFHAAFEDGRARVAPMVSGELIEAIAEPARQVGLKIAPRVVESLAADVVGEGRDARLGVVVGDRGVDVEARVGQRAVPEDAAPDDVVLRAADAALYRAKREGRDRVVRAVRGRFSGDVRPHDPAMMRGRARPSSAPGGSPKAE